MNERSDARFKHNPLSDPSPHHSSGPPTSSPKLNLSPHLRGLPAGPLPRSAPFMLKCGARHGSGSLSSTAEERVTSHRGVNRACQC
ncbi:hypothetical protein ANANG_G00148650 [Anguilla anguilla]|uniref:Uncharacterized protein n=1 Tax=Anguilla anguilla TaxID=7936 RepID=A0A9D3RUA4_ANGAN|nr:hypothetical protein ANANG_G00148650 [Anguilla anguilla]